MTFITGLKMKTPKDMDFILFECNYFPKPPRQMKDCLIMVYIQEHHSDSEYIIKIYKAPT